MQRRVGVLGKHLLEPREHNPVVPIVDVTLISLSIGHAPDNCVHQSLLQRTSHLELGKHVGRGSGETSRGFMQVQQA
jgi:hypothetical protein